jgi:TRAP-type mannitol/chloroaromatic compound transport system permease small subunit
MHHAKTAVVVDKVSTWSDRLFLADRRADPADFTWEVFSRYVLTIPHAWAFDVMIMMYGTLFMMAGPTRCPRPATSAATCCTASLNPAAQATLDLVLYFVFFMPGVFALVWAGYYFAAESWASTSIPASPPTARRSIRSRPSCRWPAPSCCLQGVVEIIRCIVCIQQGAWPTRVEDVEEVDVDKLKEMVHVKDDDIAKLDQFVTPQGGAAHEDPQGAVVRLLPDGGDPGHRRDAVSLMPMRHRAMTNSATSAC